MFFCIRKGLTINKAFWGIVGYFARVWFGKSTLLSRLLDEGNCKAMQIIFFSLVPYESLGTPKNPSLDCTQETQKHPSPLAFHIVTAQNGRNHPKLKKKTSPERPMEDVREDFQIRFQDASFEHIQACP